MKHDRIWKHLLISFTAALCLYVIGFTWVEQRRSRLGPWEITFIKTAKSAPILRVNQSSLGIEDVELAFSDVLDVANTNALIHFLPGQAVPFTVPFGECVFMDPTFLPGTVTLRIFDHEIQMLPRTLRVDGTEHGWSIGLRLSLMQTNREILHP